MSPVSRVSHAFDLHGVTIGIESSVPKADAALTSLLGIFAAKVESPALSVSIESTLDTAVLGDRLPANGSILYSNRPNASTNRANIGLSFDVYRTTNERFVDLGEYGLMVFDVGAGRAEIVLAKEGDLHEDIVSSLLLYTLSELAKPLGLRLLHAAAVALDSRAVVIPGTQGRGKTTTCLALCLAGYTFLSDDIVFLRERNGNVEICALPEHLSVTENTVRMFPRIQSNEADLTAGLLKRHILPEKLFEGRIGRRAAPAAILFPDVTGEAESRLEPLARPRALEMLLPRGLSVLDQEDAAGCFQMLSKLVAQSVCYRLQFGTDVDALRPLVDEALSSIGRA